jgi:hypothetical protein
MLNTTNCGYIERRIITLMMAIHQCHQRLVCEGYLGKKRD